MPIMGRSPIKVTAAPSTAPQEAMAASLQAHIDELVQKNRTCEHTIRRLQQALADEKERGNEAVSCLRVELQQEREEWREGCDSLLASHRIVHVRTRIELDKERLNVLLEKEENRRERINVLHRDYRLTLFQAKESELESKIGILEDALEELTDEHEHDVADFIERIKTLEKNLQRADKARLEFASLLKNREAEFSSIQSEVIALRKENATLKASSESSSVKLERTTLQLEGAKTNLAELESTTAEIKRTNTDLKRQLDRWQNLETKGGAEMEEARKRKIELEVQVKELQGRVKDLEKHEKESAKALEKERNKVEKMKKENDRMAEVTEEAQAIAKKAQDESDEAGKQLRTAQRLIEKLQSDEIPRDQGRKGKKPAYEAEIPDVDVVPESLEPSEREVETALTPAPKSRVRPRPAFKSKEVAELQETAEQEEEGEPSQRTKTRARANSNDKDQNVEEVETSAEQEDGEALHTKRASKSRARTKDGKANAPRKRKTKAPVKSDHEDESEEEVEEEKLSKSKDKGKGKAIEPPSDSADEPRVATTGKMKKRGKAHASDAGNETNGMRERHKSEDIKGAGGHSSSHPKARKTSSSQGPRIKVVDSTDDADALPKKKKKRLFPPSQAETFPWDTIPKGEGFAGLNIPTQLSPVKETDAVPARSVFGKVGSALGFR